MAAPIERHLAAREQCVRSCHDATPPHTPPSPGFAQAPTHPAGLRNLGNTCYVNASLQMLHSIGLFRDALLRLEPEIASRDVVAQMRCAGEGGLGCLR